jgi:hypothetical protein
MSRNKSTVPDRVPSDNHESDDFLFGANAPPQKPAGGPAPAPAAEPVAPSPALDPYDPATYRKSVCLEAAAGVKKELTDIRVGTPNKAHWVRCHPDPEYTFRAWVIELKEEQETYLVLPHLWPGLMGEATFKPKRLTLAVTMQGTPFLWAVRVPADDTAEPDRWMRAPLEAVRLAGTKWARITWNELSRQHDVMTCESAVEPEWPKHTMKELLRIAFKNLVIDSPDHPVLKRLRGESR